METRLRRADFKPRSDSGNMMSVDVTREGHRGRSTRVMTAARTPSGVAPSDRHPGDFNGSMQRIGLVRWLGTGSRGFVWVAD